MSDESANTSTTGFHLDDIEATWSKQDGWAGDATIQSNRIYGQPPSYHSISLTLTGTENIGGSSTNVWVYTPTGPMELPFHCSACGKRWGEGDVASTTNGEPFRHTDCSDPRLERDSEVCECTHDRFDHGFFEGSGDGCAEDGCGCSQFRVDSSAAVVSVPQNPEEK